MRINVLLFANLAEAVGCDRLTIELPEGSTAGEAIERLATEHAVIRQMRDAIAVAVDERYVSLEKPLHEGCTLALIPPVSGG